MRYLYFALILAFVCSVETLAATLEVGPDKRLQTLGDAVDASAPNDTILLTSGIYENDFVIVRHPLKIDVVGGYAILKASRPIPNGKGFIVANADLTANNLHFYNAKVPHKNGAGIRYQKGNLTVVDCIFQQNENGILGGAYPDGKILIKDSIFMDNGHGDGYSHGVYIGKIARLEIRNSYFIGTRIGHHIKSRAAETIVYESRLEDGEQSSSYSIDLPNGGNNRIEQTRIIQGKNPANPILVSIGTKDTWPNSKTLLVSNSFANLARKGIAVRNASGDPVTLSRNHFFGQMDEHQGKVESVGSQFIKEVPPYLSSPPKGRLEPDYVVIEEPASP